MITIYISGKITGTTDYKERFAEVATYLRNKGYEVVNPVELTEHLPKDTKWQDYMKVCIKALCECEEIYMMKGWHDSKGSTEEARIANMLGKKIKYEE